jgi:8-oxo-dGTP pyrophosphatase MutT (NUDIX family)
MQVVYANEAAPQTLTQSVFLAGPTPRSDDVESWRPQALRLLEQAGFDGLVFVPEDRSGTWAHDYTDQVNWEEMGLHMADAIIFWVPRDMKTLPALTTNVEWGAWCDSGKVVLGTPPQASKVRYLNHYAGAFSVPHHDNLPDTVRAALQQITPGSSRSAGERDVPLLIWRTPSFQSWYGAQRGAGNRLDGARMVWTFRVGARRETVFLWALHVNMWVAAEERHKTNEVVLARPDISTVVMHGDRSKGDDCEVVLVREFRAPAATADGYVHELPGGSSFQTVQTPETVAVEEVEEETGLVIEAARLRPHGSRQLAATLSAHKAYVFSVALTDSEIEQLRSTTGMARGSADDSERTYTELTTIKALRETDTVDWTTLGIVLDVLGDPAPETL